VVRELDKLAVRRGFFREAFAAMKLALVRFESYRRRSLHARHTAGSLDAVPETSSGTDGSDRD